MTDNRYFHATLLEEALRKIKFKPGEWLDETDKRMVQIFHENLTDNFLEISRSKMSDNKADQLFNVISRLAGWCNTIFDDRSLPETRKLQYRHEINELVLDSQVMIEQKVDSVLKVMQWLELI